jgi:hypothetical protein
MARMKRAPPAGGVRRFTRHGRSGGIRGSAVRVLSGAKRSRSIAHRGATKAGPRRPGGSNGSSHATLERGGPSEATRVRAFPTPRSRRMTIRQALGAPGTSPAWQTPIPRSCRTAIRWPLSCTPPRVRACPECNRRRGPRGGRQACATHCTSMRSGIHRQRGRAMRRPYAPDDNPAVRQASRGFSSATSALIGRYDWAKSRTRTGNRRPPPRMTPFRWASSATSASFVVGAACGQDARGPAALHLCDSALAVLGAGRCHQDTRPPTLQEARSMIP